jgi:hypothetical protein
MTLYFTNNVPLPINLDVTAYSQVAVNNRDVTTPDRHGGTASAVVDMGHTFTWSGVTSITDGDTGEPITDWTLTSASGTDWANPTVPEPCTLVLLALGAMALFSGRKFY